MNKITVFPAVHPVVVPHSHGLESVNFYIVETNEQLILVDAGFDSDECWAYFNQVLKKNNWNVADIDKIILTHHHNDHIGLVNRIRSVKNVPVFAHSEAVLRLKRDPVFMHSRINFFEKLYNDMGCGIEGNEQIKKLKETMIENKSETVDGEIRTIEEGEVINGFKVLEVPGHAPDHIALLHMESGILIAGDLIMTHIRPNALIEPDNWGHRRSSLINYYASLKKCLTYTLSVIYTGHGDFVNNPHALIARRLEQIEVKSDKFNRFIQEEPMTAAQVAKAYYRQLYETEFSLVMSQVIGYLDLLVALHKITINRKDNIFYYCPVEPFK